MLVALGGEQRHPPAGEELGIGDAAQLGDHRRRLVEAALAQDADDVLVAQDGVAQRGPGEPRLLAQALDEALARLDVVHGQQVEGREVEVVHQGRHGRNLAIRTIAPPRVRFWVMEPPAEAAPEAVLDHIGPGADIVLPLANGEPVRSARRDRGGRRSPRGRARPPDARPPRPAVPRTARSATACATSRTSCRHVTRPCFRGRHRRPRPQPLQRDAADPRATAPTIRSCWRRPRCRIATATSRLGLNADYVASFIGRARFFLEANPAMPRTFGRNQVHVSQIVGWTRADYPLVEVHPPAPTEADERIAALLAERIPDGATIQTGIGAIPNAILAALPGPPRPRRPHRAHLRRRRSTSSSAGS